MRTRLAALALTLPLGLAALTACEDDSSAAGDATASTGSTSGADAGGSGAEVPDVSEGEELSAEEFGALMVAAFEKATTADLVMSMTAGGQDIEVTGQADYSSDPVSMRMEMTGMGGTGDMEIIVVDNAMYMKLAVMSDKFLKLDLDDPDNPVGGSFTGQLDPRAQAEVIEQGLQTATYVGQEEVDGETLDHYTAVVDSQAMLEQLEGAGDVAGQLPETVTYELWLTEDGLYRQMEIDMGAVAGEMLMRFEDWGTDVDIEAPPASQVTDMGDMAGMMG
ncbi:MAG: LppX_LprAFG lipoprotein [Actinobacteria bacterium]|nr:LppX_LprAFG lipoprotein [Actinomycetota bacterium]MBU2110978.1 LppX_LprAFG lipoprotein [Actinomycetota bacterium]